MDKMTEMIFKTVPHLPECDTCEVGDNVCMDCPILIEYVRKKILEER